MTAYFVSRHKGAIDWARAQGIEARHIEHLELDAINAGDKVLGTLPVSIAAEVCARGARYFHLSLDVPASWRGRELTAEDMTLLGAVLEEFYLEKRQ